MWVELEFKLTWKLDGESEESFEKRYKIEDGGPDEDYCSLTQEARQRLCHKMMIKIDEVCKNGI